MEHTLESKPVLCRDTARVTPANMHSSEIYQFFQEHVKYNDLKIIDPKNSNFTNAE